MSDELSVMFHAAAHKEAVAAEREFPMPPDDLDRFVGRVRRRRVAISAALALAGVVVVGGAALGIGQLWPTTSVVPGGTPSPTSSPSVDPSASPSPSVEASPMPTASPTEIAPTPTTTTPPPSVPGQVTVISAFPGGQSGMIQVEWDMVTNATGYRVYRSVSQAGPFAPSASFDVTTGIKTIEIGVPYEGIWLGVYSSGTLDYTELVDGQPACFRVAAFNSEGEGPRSVVVCSDPQAGEPGPEPSTSSP